MAADVAGGVEVLKARRRSPSRRLDVEGIVRSFEIFRVGGFLFHLAHADQRRSVTVRPAIHAQDRVDEGGVAFAQSPRALEEGELRPAGTDRNRDAGRLEQWLAETARGADHERGSDRPPVRHHPFDPFSRHRDGAYPAFLFEYGSGTPGAG